MFDRQVLLHFSQHDLEPFYSAWWRYKQLLITFPDHGFSRECQLQNFFDGLCAPSRYWVERGNGTTSFYQLIADEAYQLLEEMTDYDYWCCKYSMSNQGWENNSNIEEPWFDAQPHNIEVSPELLAIVDRFSEETRIVLEKRESREGPVPNEEPPTVEVFSEFLSPFKQFGEGTSIVLDEYLVLLDDDSVCEEGNQDLVFEEQKQEEVFEAHPNSFVIKDATSEEETQDLVMDKELQVDIIESHLIVPALKVEEYIYEDPMWPIIIPPTLASFLWAHQSYLPKPNHVEITCKILPYHAKLEGIHNQDPYVVLYDTYYGRTPLFDECFSNSQADDYKSSASWEATQVF